MAYMCVILNQLKLICMDSLTTFNGQAGLHVIFLKRTSGQNLTKPDL